MPSEMGEGCYWPQTCIREAAYADCRVTWRALTHVRDTHVPVEEPSTASIADQNAHREPFRFLPVDDNVRVAAANGPINLGPP